ncbi:MAG: hypothetical protein Q4G34_04810 [Micrococcus sp.]|nr:hypothetical protein [Micrococcus sp.]
MNTEPTPQRTRPSTTARPPAPTPEGDSLKASRGMEAAGLIVSLLFFIGMGIFTDVELIWRALGAVALGLAVSGLLVGLRSQRHR